MDNLGKALHIAVGVLLFIIALTSSIILYDRVMDYIDAGLRVSNSDKRAEEATDIYTLYERPISHSEIIMSLVKIHDTNADIVKVNGKEYSTIKTNPAGNVIEEKVASDKIFVDGFSKNINAYGFHEMIPSGTYTYSYSVKKAKDIDGKDTEIKIMTYTKE